jgi:hypothetical protein
MFKNLLVKLFPCRLFRLTLSLGNNLHKNHSRVDAIMNYNVYYLIICFYFRALFLTIKYLIFDIINFNLRYDKTLLKMSNCFLIIIFLLLIQKKNHQ